MNYQQRNRALSECIRVRCKRTARKLKAADKREADFIVCQLFYV
jgi:hypothetical protein